ncbi:chitinase 1 precursor, putative [Cordyceps militaris CM01]|uniref:Chitinase 1, putative n=1 Tax=Cordyceps militaris (strain CM01) TaxID=983644 RepID=G3JSM4_CORMM|nr:chitinase 1 precursor, putative [Cordyceps militaris CM01]EGX88870.1 chitinase 1 precursor, putative [Cordyceps militaris CM01]
MVSLRFLPPTVRLLFGGRKQSEGQTATTASSTTDVSSQAEWVDAEKSEATKITAVAAHTDTTKTDAAKPALGKPRWPLWLKLAVAGCAFAIVCGLAVGLGVGLTRHKHTASSHSEGVDSPSDSVSSNSSQKPSMLSVYWGAKRSGVSLDTVCADPSYDTVNLAFLSHFFGQGQYPRLAISSLNGSSAAQRLAGAVDLQDGTTLAPAIRACQAAGKRVLLSMGGAAGYAEVRLASDAQGRQVADTLWDLFLGGDKMPEIRPFGDVVLDGVDFGRVDNESGESTGYEAMAARLRTHFASAPGGRRYYLTAAPQCPPTTAADEEAALRLFRGLDAVAVQFYNNNACNVGASGFEASVRRWSAALGGGGDGGHTTLLLVGALASAADKDRGYVEAGALAGVKAMGLGNYGGVMLWEAELAAQNGDYQKKIRSAV